MSALSDVRDRIVQLVEAATPPTDTARTYHHWTSPGAPKDASGHRGFVVRWLSGGEYVAHGDAVSEQRSEVEVRVTYTRAGLNVESAMFDALADEGVVIANAIDRGTSWPAGTLMVQTGARRAELIEDSNDVDLVVPVTIETQEA